MRLFANRISMYRLQSGSDNKLYLDLIFSRLGVPAGLKKDDADTF